MTEKEKHVYYYFYVLMQHHIFIVIFFMIVFVLLLIAEKEKYAICIAIGLILSASLQLPCIISKIKANC